MWVAKQAAEWVSAGVRTWSEGKGPTNAEWQLIMPDRYISICPLAPCLPLRACRCHQAFQQRHTHTRWHDYLTNTPCSAANSRLHKNLIKQRLCGASGHRNKLQLHLMCAYLRLLIQKHIFVRTHSSRTLPENRSRAPFQLPGRERA